MTPVRDALRTVRSEPRPPAAPRRGRGDLALFAVLLAVVLVEAALRRDLAWSSPSVVVGCALTATVLGRRSHPLGMAVLAYGATAVLDALRLAGAADLPDLQAPLVLLLLPYALLR